MSKLSSEKILDKCLYCGKPIYKPAIRCTSCDTIWKDGFAIGEQEIKSKIWETLGFGKEANND